MDCCNSFVCLSLYANVPSTPAFPAFQNRIQELNAELEEQNLITLARRVLCIRRALVVILIVGPAQSAAWLQGQDAEVES